MIRSDYPTYDYPASDADILIVDDNPANVELLLNLLEDEGYTRIEGITNPLLVEPRPGTEHARSAAAGRTYARDHRARSHGAPADTLCRTHAGCHCAYSTNG